MSILRTQSLYIAISAIVGAVFWAIGQAINPLTILLYSLSTGNLINRAMEKLEHIYADRSFPYDWLLYLALLLFLVPPVYLISTTIVWLLAPPVPQTLGHLITTGWKFPVLITFVFSVLTFLFHTTKERLERRNLELERSVERGTAQLALQEEEFERGREIQESLLPKEIPQLRGFEIAGAWRPARAVSGDYYDVFRLGERRLAICIADVAGKGVSAALLMANVQAAVHAFASETEGPAGLCGKVNRLLCGNLATGKFVTFLFGILDGDKRTMEYCNAGHLDPILVSNGAVRTLDSGGAVLGVFPDWRYEDRLIELQSGDRLLLFTDGITEAAGADEQEFGEANVAACAQANCRRTASELNSALIAQVDGFCGSHFHDDATLLVIAAQ
jgi:sigma-B regulation protein RsbU (phosphoserine phosphatase)